MKRQSKSQEKKDPEVIREYGGRVLHHAHNFAGLVRSVQNGLRLPKTLHLLLQRSLARVEVLEREVAGLVQVSLLVLVLLLLVERGDLVLLRVRLVHLLGGLLLALVRDVAGLLLDGGVRVLHEGLVGLLRVGLGLDGVGLMVFASPMICSSIPMTPPAP